MNKRMVRLAALAVSAVLIANERASAQFPPDVEQIVATLSATPPGNVFEQFYPDHNLPAPYFKVFSFFGSVTNASTQQPAFVDLWFDWIDPSDPSGTPPRTSGIFPIDLAPGAVRTIPPTAPITFTLPFCPPQVSIHIQNNGPGQPVIVNGTFIHECRIPEPGTATLVGLCVAGLGGAARRRSKGRSMLRN